MHQYRDSMFVSRHGCLGEKSALFSEINTKLVTKYSKISNNCADFELNRILE